METELLPLAGLQQDGQNATHSHKGQTTLANSKKGHQVANVTEQVTNEKALKRASTLISFLLTDKFFPESMICQLSNKGTLVDSMGCKCISHRATLLATNLLASSAHLLTVYRK